jgi:hypothetical protein
MGTPKKHIYVNVAKIIKTILDYGDTKRSAKKKI